MTVTFNSAKGRRQLEISSAIKKKSNLIKRTQKSRLQLQLKTANQISIKDPAGNTGWCKSCSGSCWVGGGEPASSSSEDKNHRLQACCYLTIWPSCVKPLPVPKPPGRSSPAWWICSTARLSLSLSPCVCSLGEDTEVWCRSYQQRHGLPPAWRW